MYHYAVNMIHRAMSLRCATVEGGGGGDLHTTLHEADALRGARVCEPLV